MSVRTFKLLVVMSQVLLDAGVVGRCRYRVHLENDPTVTDVVPVPPDPATEQRMADAAAHRVAVLATIRDHVGEQWVEIDQELSVRQRENATLQAMRAGAMVIGGATLPRDEAGHRRGRIPLLIHAGDGYLPVLVVRHRITDPGSGARTSPLTSPFPAAGGMNPLCRTRPQPRDQLRLAHAYRMLLAAGHAASTALGGVIGLDADLVLWHDLNAVNWPGDRSTLTEYDARFADRVEIALAAAMGMPPLTQASRIVECRRCPWWSRCSAELTARRDVSLVVRGEDAYAMRNAGMRTVDELAMADPKGAALESIPDGQFADMVVLARAWLADLTLVRRVRELSVPRADVEVDVDMESFGEAGAYLWGCWLSGVPIGEAGGYRAFVTWKPLPAVDEARSFAEFWRWFGGIRARAAKRGLSFRAYCYNELAENRWLLASADRFAGYPGVPSRQEVEAFIGSTEWVDLYRIVSEQFLCAHGKGLKVVAPEAGFHWRDAEAGGENSMCWYRYAVGMDGGESDLGQRKRLLEYNEDDVRATYTLREWMSTTAVDHVPFAGDL